ncbi:MAG: type sorting protein [Segetibacter sp.]|nr:type sorting protein [Segetibacter sp.]
MKKIYITIFTVLLYAAAAAQASLADFRASARLNTVEVTWTALSETNMVRHEVERSANGSSFTVIGALPAQNITTSYKYSYLDATPVEGNNYYRLRSTSRSGSVVLSDVVRMNMGRGRSNMTVLPNPVVNGTVNLQLTNIDKGKYLVQLVSSGGLRVFNRSFDHPGGSSTEIIDLPATINKGIYFLHITNGDTRFNKQILIN